MRNLSLVSRTFLACCLVLLGACATQDQNGGQVQRLPSDFEDIAVDVGSLGGGYLRNGVFVPAALIQQVAPGASRAEVQSILGTPAISTSPDWWFYNINLPLEGLDDYLVCQYRVAFAGDVVSEAVWRRRQCQVLHDGQLARAASAARAIAAAPSQPQEITLSSDVLFEFDSPALTQAGRLELTDVARVVLRDLQLVRVDVVGHADRTGAEAYNELLSLRRARSVADFLVSEGIPADMIFSEGRGSRDPVVTCEGSVVTEQLKRCLQPNRRVEITINGRR